MLRFQPAGFVQKPLATDLGVMVYYTNVAAPAIDTPTLVFLHSLGGGSSAFEWSLVYPALADTYRVVAPDLIGWGQSSHPVRSYRVEDYFTMITQLLTSLEGPRLVAATSLTAGVMVRLAIQRPDLCQGLFLVSPAGNSDFGRDYRLSLPALLASTPGLDRLLYQVGAANPLAVRWFFSNFLLADRRRLTPTMVQAYLTCTQQPQAQYAALASLSGAISFDLANYIGQLSLPTAVVLGQKSRFLPAAVGRRLASLNPQAITAIHEIPDAGVPPHLECPEAVVGPLRDFAEMVLASPPIR
jgi:pimeloyl-ACP methyl ester carboxylesterase